VEVTSLWTPIPASSSNDSLAFQAVVGENRYFRLCPPGESTANLQDRLDVCETFHAYKIDNGTFAFELISDRNQYCVSAPDDGSDSVRPSTVDGPDEIFRIAVSSKMLITVPVDATASTRYRSGKVVTGSASETYISLVSVSDSDGLGAAVLALPISPPPRTFCVSFDMLVGRGSGADGMAFSYGDFDDVDLNRASETGVGLGLVLSFDTYNNNGKEEQGIGLAIGGKRLAHDPDVSKFRKHGWVPVFISMAETANGEYRVRVGLGGNNLFDVAWRGEWAVKSTWRMTFSARIGFYNDDHFVKKIVVNAFVPPDHGNTAPEPILECDDLIRVASKGKCVITFPSFQGNSTSIPAGYLQSINTSASITVDNVNLTMLQGSGPFTFNVTGANVLDPEARVCVSYAQERVVCDEIITAERGMYIQKSLKDVVNPDGIYDMEVYPVELLRNQSQSIYLEAGMKFLWWIIFVPNNTGFYGFALEASGTRRISIWRIRTSPRNSQSASHLLLLKWP